MMSWRHQMAFSNVVSCSDPVLICVVASLWRTVPRLDTDSQVVSAAGSARHPVVGQELKRAAGPF